MIDLATAKEPDLKTFLTAQLDNDFFIRREVWGMHLITREKVKADFVLQPKSHLLGQGFDDGIFVVEVKAVYGSNLSPRTRMEHAITQSATYVQSRFDFGQPMYSVLFPAFGIFLREQFATIGNKNDRELVLTNVIRSVQNMAMFQHVACLEMDTDYYTKEYVWKISMGGQRLFSIPDGRNPANMLRERIGNFEG